MRKVLVATGIYVEREWVAVDMPSRAEVKERLLKFGR